MPIDLGADGREIYVTFDYDPELVELVKTLPNRRWNKGIKAWIVPATPSDARAVIAVLGAHLSISERVKRLSETQFGIEPATDLDYIPKIRPKQREAIRFINTGRARVIVADDVGVGKTIEALGYIYNHEKIKRVVVVCPSIVLYKWADEIGTWLEEGDKCQIVGTGATALDKDKRYWLMTYNIMVKKSDELLGHKIDLLVFDEGHYLKDPNSQRSRAGALISKVANGILMLSGTPFLNKPYELWTLLDMLNPGAWGSRFKFGLRYCDGHKEFFGWRFEGLSNEKELRQRLKDVMIRRTLLEAKPEMPVLTRSVLPIDISNIRCYNEASKDLVRFLQKIGKNYSGAIRAQTLVKLNYLNQLCGVGKVDAAVEWSKDFLKSTGDKLVIFAHHKEVVAQLEEALDGYSPVCITGSDAAKSKYAKAQRFQTSKTTRVAIISEAAGEGVNLHAACNLLMAERLWNPGKEAQIEGRLQREGQERPVIVHYLVARNTVDYHVNHIIERKRGMVDMIIKPAQVEGNIIESLLLLMKGG